MRAAHTLGQVVAAVGFVTTAAAQVAIYFTLVVLAAFNRGPLARRRT